MKLIRPNTFAIVVGVISLPLIYLVFTYCGDDDYWWVSNCCEVTLILIGLASALKALAAFGRQFSNDSRARLAPHQSKKHRIYQYINVFGAVMLDFVTGWSIVFTVLLTVLLLILDFCTDAFSQEVAVPCLLITLLPSLVAGIWAARPAFIEARKFVESSRRRAERAAAAAAAAAAAPSAVASTPPTPPAEPASPAFAAKAPRKVRRRKSAGVIADADK